MEGERAGSRGAEDFVALMGYWGTFGVSGRHMITGRIAAGAYVIPNAVHHIHKEC